MRTVWVFTCPDCGKDFYLGAARLGEDSELRCGRCDDGEGWQRGFHYEPPEVEKEIVAFVCANCGDEFTPARSDARYCSTRCRVAAHRRTTVT